MAAVVDDHGIASKFVVAITQQFKQARSILEDEEHRRGTRHWEEGDHQD